MNSALFEHIKHRLSETAVPDPDQGWQQMNVLLDDAGGARKAPTLRWWYAAACLLLVSAGWALFHGNHAPVQKNGVAVSLPKAGVPSAPTAAGMTVPSAGAIVPPAGVAVPSTEGAISLNAGSATGGSRQTGASAVTNPFGSSANAAHSGASVTGTPPGSFVTALPGNAAVPGASDLSASSPVSLSAETESHRLQDLQYAPLSGKYLMDLPQGRLIAGSMKPLAIPVTPMKNTSRLPRWGFEIGLGANAPGSLRKITQNDHNTTNLGIYPIAFVDYRLTHRWTLRAGLAAPAPVAYSSMPTHTTISTTVNDSLQSTQTVSEKNKIGRLVYLDIPVTAQFAVFPHFTVEAGVQLSRLLTEQEDTKTASTVSPGFIAYATNYMSGQVPLAQTHNTQQVRKTDPRYLLGANYQLHRFSAGLQYQGGLLKSVNQTDDEGNVLSNRTSIVRMQINYRLR